MAVKFWSKAPSTRPSQIINAPLILEGTSYTFESDGTGTNNTGLVIGGDISGGASGPTTLTLQGTNEVSTTMTNTEITGAITNGASSVLNLLVTSLGLPNGTWELASTTPSTYTGTTTITGDTLLIGTADALPATTDVTISGTGVLENNVLTGPFPTVHSVTDNGGTNASGGYGFYAANGNDVLNIDNNTGPALILNAQPNTIEAKYDAVFDLTGTGPSGTGGILFTNSTGMTTVTEDEKPFDLGSVNRDIYVTRGTYSTDLQLQNLTDTADGGGGGIIFGRRRHREVRERGREHS